MACYSPITGYRAPGGGIKFSRAGAFRDLPITIPCGNCIGCRLEKARQWAVRISHEAQMHEHNCFITLTYNEESLPENGSLNKEDIQLFFKRLRSHLSPKTIRFYQVGEYGDQDDRPHHHACIFGYDFPDQIKLKNTAKDKPLFSSPLLAKLWKKGFCTVQELNPTTAAYTARYAMKKINGSQKENHYSRLNTETGELIQLRPEKASMSNRPGIGSTWYDKYKNDLYPSDECVIKGKITQPPNYYDLKFKEENPDEFKKIKIRRTQRALKHKEDSTPDRLAVKEEVKKAQIKSLTRQ